MPFPLPTPARHRISGACAFVIPFALLITLRALARQPDPPQRIPLEPFGFQTISTRYLLEGATMLTLDYVDDQHLLVTFGVSKLMKRLADCPADDQDRTVKAVLLELPSGRELAHTEWRFHDLGQYLWNLGGGHFILRKRDVLTSFAPLQDLASTDGPFTERPFLHLDRRIQAIVVSADGQLLSIESVKRPPPKSEAVLQAQSVSQSVTQSSAQSGTQPAPRIAGLQRRDPNAPRPDPTPTEIDFIRVLRVPIVKETAPARASNEVTKTKAKAEPDPASPAPIRIAGRLDGRIFTANAVNVPLTTEGFLRAKATTRDGILLDFLTFTGKDIDLGDFATSCTPRPTFVSPSEFVAFGCRGSDGSLDLAGFNLRGDFLWQINFTDEQAYPGFVSAIPAGRFAFSRTVTSTHVFGNETPSMDQLQAQEVRVIQTYNGKQLLRVVTSPIQRAGQNFALSPDGLALAVIHDNPTAKSDVVTHATSIEIYALPPLSDKDSAQIKLEAAMAPAPAPANSEVHMRFSSDEIKAALAEKPDTTDSPPSSEANPADSRIAGDPIPAASASSSAAQSAPAATSASGTIPSSDPAPACATLTGHASSAPAACPVSPQQNASPAPAANDPDAPAEKRRKPPTLYEPAPATPPQ
jgi:hypothetical protein